MAADDLAPYVAKPSAAMILTTSHRLFLLFHKEGFELPILFLHGEMIYTVKSLI